MASLGLPGPGRVLGRVPGDPGVVLAREAGRRLVRWRGRHALDVPHRSWSSRRSGRCSPPATCCGCSNGSRSARSKEEFENAHIHDVHVPEWIAWAPLLGLIVALGVYPEPGLRHDERRGRERREGLRGLNRRMNPHLDFHALAAGDHPHGDDRRSSLVADLLFEDRQRWQTSRHREHRRARRADPRPHARGRRRQPLDVRRRLRRRQLRARVQGLLPRRHLRRRC